LGLFRKKCRFLQASIAFVAIKSGAKVGFLVDACVVFFMPHGIGSGQKSRLVAIPLVKWQRL
jgi:hypothetical protein